MNKTERFLALSLIDDLNRETLLLDSNGVEGIKIAAIQLLHDAKQGGFKGVYGLLEGVLTAEPCHGADVVRGMAERAYSGAVLVLEGLMGV